MTKSKEPILKIDKRSRSLPKEKQTGLTDRISSKILDTYLLNQRHINQDNQISKKKTHACIQAHHLSEKLYQTFT